MHTNIRVALKPNFMIYLYFLKCAFSSITIKTKIFITKIPKDSLFIFLVLNAVFIIVYQG